MEREKKANRYITIPTLITPVMLDYLDEYKEKHHMSRACALRQIFEIGMQKVVWNEKQEDGEVKM